MWFKTRLKSEMMDLSAFSIDSEMISVRNDGKNLCVLAPGSDDAHAFVGSLYKRHRVTWITQEERESVNGNLRDRVTQLRCLGQS